MTPIRNLLTIIVLFLMGMSANATTTLDSVLINTNELKLLHQEQQARFLDSHEQLKGAPVTIYTTNSISKYTNQFDDISQRLQNRSCIFPELGCVFVAYTENTERIEYTKKGNSIGSQLLLKSFLESESFLNPVKKDAYKAIYKFFKHSLAPNSSVNKIEQNFDRLSHEEINFHDFEIVVYENPNAFYVLPTLYTKLLSNRVLLSYQFAFEQMMQNTYLITLDAIYQGANSDLGSYPFKDDLAKPGTLMDVAKLYSTLKNGNRDEWPTFASLTFPIRKKLAGPYLNKTTDGSRWVVKATYNDVTNIIWIDYSAPFYENIYVVYHELWHVLWNHSSLARNSVQKVINQLEKDSNPNADINLKTSLLNLVSANEFLALDQQIRLYHATSPNTSQWTNQQFDSTKNWHDSYLGQNIYQRLITSTDRKSVEVVGKGLFKATGGRLDLNFRASTFLPNSLARAYSENRWNEKYFSSQLKMHNANFDKIYLNNVLLDSLDFKDQENDALSELNSGMLLHYSPFQLSCAQVNRILRALGKDWSFGIPFAYTQTDPVCVDNNSGHPSTEGSHPSTEGSHPELEMRGFPSLDGPNVMEFK